MFDYGKFVLNNLKSGFDNGSFSAEQVNIYAVNYRLKGTISNEQFNDIIDFVNPKQEQNNEDEEQENEVHTDE